MDSTLVAYIINLKTSVNRYKHMQNILFPYGFVKPQFVEAVDGRKMTDEELDQQFDNKETIRQYGRVLNRGEIGCTLSHRKCYAELLASDAPYALVLEDDIAIMRDLTILKEVDIDAIMNSPKATILFLSGDYWFYKKNNVVNAYEAVGSYAYIVNRAAAKAILSIKFPYNVADDWSCYKREGVKYKAFYPYLIDANTDMDTFPSDIKQDQWGNKKKLMSKRALFDSYRRGMVKRLLAAIGHFEAKIRVIDNKEVSV